MERKVVQCSFLVLTEDSEHDEDSFDHLELSESGYSDSSSPSESVKLSADVNGEKGGELKDDSELVEDSEISESGCSTLADGM